MLADVLRRKGKVNLLGPKAISVTEQGEPDGWEIKAGFDGQTAQDGSNRLLVSVPTEQLLTVHSALMGLLGSNVGVLYRQFIDRRNPGPNNAPPTDFVGLDLSKERVAGALSAAKDLIYHDARCELWLRGEMGDQVILDRDGLIYCYPDDPAFRDLLSQFDLMEGEIEVLLERDYVRHLFHSQNDVIEDSFIENLGLSRIGGQ